MTSHEGEICLLLSCSVESYGAIGNIITDDYLKLGEAVSLLIKTNKDDW